MYNLFSVKLLFESTYNSQPLTPEKIFEERIVLVRIDKQENIHNCMYAYFPPDTYVNAEGGMTTNQLVRILDVFELVEDIFDPMLETEYKEIYSRYIIVPENTSVEACIELYALDK